MLLVVEDSILLLQFLNHVLTGQGFEVETASSGAEALERLGNDASRFCAVVTDIHLGKGPDGWDVADRARVLVPDIPVVYMTSRGNNDWKTRGVIKSVMVCKPFTFSQILATVTTLLTGVNTSRDLAE